MALHADWRRAHSGILFSCTPLFRWPTTISLALPPSLRVRSATKGGCEEIWTFLRFKVAPASVGPISRKGSVDSENLCNPVQSRPIPSELNSGTKQSQDANIDTNSSADQPSFPSLKVDLPSASELKEILAANCHGDARKARAFLESYYIASKTTLRDMDATAITDLAQIYDSHGMINLAKAIRSPRILSEDELRHAKQFCRDHIDSNSSLSPESKSFMNDMATRERGPWVVPNHVQRVREDSTGKITVAHQCGEAYYRLPQSPEDFLSSFVAENDGLSAQSKKFLSELVGSEQGPWSLQGHVKSVREDSTGKITVAHQCGESYYRLPQPPEDFLNSSVAGNKRLSPHAKDFLSAVVESERGPWSLKGHVESVTEEGWRINVGTRDGEAYYYPGLPTNRVTGLSEGPLEYLSSWAKVASACVAEGLYPPFTLIVKNEGGGRFLIDTDADPALLSTLPSFSTQGVDTFDGGIIFKVDARGVTPLRN